MDDAGDTAMLPFLEERWPELLIALGILAELIAIVVPWL